MSDVSPASLWPVLHYADSRAAVRFLVDVLGFRPATVVDDGSGTGDVLHAELRWPGGGALVLGTTNHTESIHGGMPSGANALYVVTDAAGVDGVHERVRAAGGVVVAPPNDTRFGTGAAAYACSVRDPEGNLWTFGTYRGVD